MKRIFIILAVLVAGASLTSCNMDNTKETQTDIKMENPVIDNIMSRRTIRKFKGEAVAPDTMQTILECGINAPNGMNRQSWEVRVIDNPAVMEKFIGHIVNANPQASAESVKGSFRGAPTLVAIAHDPSYDLSVIDCGLLSENMILSAWSMGIGSVCLGISTRFLKNSPEAIQMLGFSEGFNPILCIGFGYPDEAPQARPRDPEKVKFIEQ